MTKAERVDHFEMLMRTGEFRHGLTTKEYARKWGKNAKVLSAEAAEASRRLMIPKEEMETRRAQHGAFLEAVLAHARTCANKMTGQPDYRNIVEAWRMYAEYVLGWKTERDRSEGPNVAALTDDQLLELAEKAAAVIKASKKE